MSKKKEKIRLTPDQEKFIELHRKKYLRKAEYDNETIVDELKANLIAFVRYNPNSRKSVKLSDGKTFKPNQVLVPDLILAAHQIRLFMHRYHNAFIEYKITGHLKSDPLLSGNFYELYEATAKAMLTLERINEIVHAMTYLEKQVSSFALPSLMYKLGSQVQAVETLRMRPAAEKTLHKIAKDNKRDKPSRSLPEEFKPWLLERAIKLDTKDTNRLSMFKQLALELKIKWPVKKPFGWRCLQNYLLPLLQPRHIKRSKNKLREIEDWR